ncbi:hypothetical protein GCM10011521_20870 [Arenimonas soli]|uniref:Uncharacterized protein n=1 Tax=Arenimonas soli TaxID=2269504 RepID=A0ABQ1HLL2_9GAMM|nr:hypothetical protein [Arenimonas soli]GGA82333.1 hypothetical protein GCM10011521_20870 [Arenimonas soli]
MALARKVGAIEELEELCIRCLESGVLIAITLKSGKVYVGIPEAYSILDGEKKWIGIWPMASGYRDSEQGLVLKTYYQPHYELMERSGESCGPTLDDFRIVLPRSEVSSAQSFDLPTYARFGFGVPAAEGSALDGDGAASAQVTNLPDTLDQMDEIENDGSEIDNASELSAEIMPPEDAALLRIYFGFVVSFSMFVVLVSGTAVSAFFLAASLYCLVRLLQARDR